MSQFAYLNEINSAFIMDGDISKGPMPRWQKKLNGSSANLNASANTSKISISYNSVLSTSTTAPTTNKTPQKNSSVNFKGKSPGTDRLFQKDFFYCYNCINNHFFRRLTGRKTPTPNKNAGSKTPNGGAGGDRFIPNRASTNFDLGHYKVSIENVFVIRMQCIFSPESDTYSTATVYFNLFCFLFVQMKMQQNAGDENEENSRDNDRQKMLSEAMQIGDVNTRRIFSYQEKAPPAPESHQNPLRVVYSIKTPMSTKSGTRYIPTSPERILDAPDIINDYCEYFSY